jgi:hypothetical protein
MGLHLMIKRKLIRRLRIIVAMILLLFSFSVAFSYCLNIFALWVISKFGAAVLEYTFYAYCLSSMVFIFFYYDGRIAGNDE